MADYTQLNEAPCASLLGLAPERASSEVRGKSATALDGRSASVARSKL